MDFTVDAVPPQQFAAWAARTKGRGPVLDAAGYHALARQRGNLRPFAYGSVPQGFFAAVVREAGAPVHEVDNGGREN